MATVPFEVYLRTSYEPEMEYAYGRLIDRHVGEYTHSRMQVSVAAELGRRERERRYLTLIALRVRVTDEPRIRVPDISVIGLPYRPTAIPTRVDLAVEILSPEDEPVEMLTKVVDYQAAGVPYVWFVDPYRRTLVESVGGRLRRPEGEVLATPLVGDVDFTALFAELDGPAE